ncbi:MAG: hypothetical protein KDE31_17945, partial [Caldilineaceae bacterium]|nr:hypothetical protein [Caldilineaceae bacterium]
MDSSTSLANLRGILAELYTETASIRRVLADADIKAAYIALDGPAIDIWHAILVEAIQKDGTGALERVVCNEYDKYQALHAAWQTLNEQLDLGLDPLVDERVPGESPYKGLHFFDVQDAHLFFGREALTTALVTCLQEQNFLAVIGASGSGKSSLVRAGLIPALQGTGAGMDHQRSQDHWLIHLLTPGAHPLEQLAATLTTASESVTAQATLLDDLTNDVRALRLYASRMVNTTNGGRLLLVVDQFEELFTLCREPLERQQFIANLMAATDNDGATTIVLTLRADFYHRCAEFADLRTALERYQRYIGSMTASELRLAIEEPANANGWRLEDGLVELLLTDVAEEPGALPLLSHALLETWQRRQGRILTLAGYTASGRVQGAIAQTAETVYHRRLTDEQQPVARAIFVRLTELGEGAQDTRRRVTIAELLPPQAERAEVVKEVVKRLTDARLITVDREQVEVAHEALIREWQTLRNWLEEDREGLRIHRHLTEAARQWEASNRDQSYLFLGTRLQLTREWAAGATEQLNKTEDAFLRASQQVADDNERRVAEIQQRELEQARQLAIEAEARRKAEEKRAQEAEARRSESEESQRKLKERARIFRVVALVALVATIFSFQQSALAFTRSLSAQAQALMKNGDYDLAALIAL